MLISVIIPVYKVEKYLNRCIDSVITQYTNDIEIILVDDGSPDGSGAICDFYKEKYPRISVIHKTNGGLSSARNAGIEIATGEYILLLDSDDWLFENSIYAFCAIIKDEKPDLIVGKAVIIDENGKSHDKLNYYLKKGLYTRDEYISHLVRKNCYSACAPFTLYRRDFLINHDLHFYEGIVQEDELWTPTVLMNAKSVYYSDVYFYYNYVRSDSITHSTHKSIEGDNLLTVVQEVYKLFQINNINKANVLTDKMVFNYLRGICLVDDFYKDVRKIQGKILIKYSMFPKTKMKACLYTISNKLYFKIHDVVKKRIE